GRRPGTAAPPPGRTVPSAQRRGAEGTVRPGGGAAVPGRRPAVRGASLRGGQGAAGPAGGLPAAERGGDEPRRRAEGVRGRHRAPVSAAQPHGTARRAVPFPRYRPLAVRIGGTERRVAPWPGVREETFGAEALT